MIRLFNSLTQQKEPFEPRDPGKAGIYCCGPTVYNQVHIGNARPYVTFAVLRSWLRQPRPRVTLVTNITDIDDKIINKGNAEGRDPAAVAEQYADAYGEDTDRLGLARPDIEPMATGHIEEIIDLIASSSARDHAYPARTSTSTWIASRVRKLSKQRMAEIATAPASTSRRARPTRSISPSGRAPSRASRPGTAPGGRDGRAGTSSARP